MHGRGVGQLRRIPKASLNHAPDAMHGARAAGLSAGLELLGDLLQKLRPRLLIDRPGQAHQNGHFFVGKLQRHRGLLQACGRAR
jgi:hypothetical protein